MLFRNQNNANATAKPASFADKLRGILDSKIREGRDGMDLNEGKKGKSPYIVYRHFDMSDETFDLGCAINERFNQLTPEVWLAWMTDAEVKNLDDGVVVYHRSKFFCDGVEKNLGQILTDYFGKKVQYMPDRFIQDGVIR